MTPQEIILAPNGATLWDDQVAGLHLRVGLGGSRRWFLFYRTKSGRQRRPKIGDYPEVLLQEARRRASLLKARVALGEDPKGDWDASRAERTVSELWAEVWKAHWDTPRYQLSGWAAEVCKLYTSKIRTAFGGCRLSEVTPGMVREWHRGMAETPTSANRSLEVLSKLYSWAEENEIRPPGSNPCALVKANTEGQRERFATPQEAAKIGEILRREAHSHPLEVAFIGLLMLTGSRPRALERARREWLTGCVLRFKGKSTAATGKEEIVVFPETALRIVNALPIREDGLLIGIQFPKRFWQRVKIEAGCPDLWARDWRRTFASYGLSEGVESALLGELLNHSSAQTTKRYARLLLTNRLAAAEKISATVDSYSSASSLPDLLHAALPGSPSESPASPPQLASSVPSPDKQSDA
jgi:integrase